MKIKKTHITFKQRHGDLQLNALAIIPDESRLLTDRCALFTHGFTSHKASILNWPLRIAEEGCPCLLFDLPGHYLGTFSEVTDFENFKAQAHLCFTDAINKLTQIANLKNINKVMLAGHSLGALLALKAVSEPEFQKINERYVAAVGFGLPPKGVTHIFDTPFYKSTLKVRAQLVSPALSPDVVFPWIKEEKEKLILSNENIFFLTGDDDVVVGKDGSERLAKQLEEQGNRTQLERPSKLAHHQPELAAAHLKKYLKDINFFS